MPAGAIAAVFVLFSPISDPRMANAQTVEAIAQDYSREAMEQALATKERYELYGILFDTDSATIQPASGPLLDDIASALGNFPDWRLLIVGHTDTIGDASYNMNLSLERATAIKVALQDRSVDAARLVAAGRGVEQPVASNETPEGRALNRRVELIRTTDSAAARELLRGMSDFLAGQDRLAYDYDATFEIVTNADQKLGLASSGTVTLDRPDRIRASSSGGFLDVEVLFDGTTLTLFGRNANSYTQVAEPGSLDKLFDRLREGYGRPLPAADLLLSNPYEALIEEVYDAKDLGSGVIDGTECDWLAFRTAEVDWQIWIAQGERPYPCRYVITSKTVPGIPQYTIQLGNWRFGDQVAADTFTFDNQTGAALVPPEDLRAKMSELPGHFMRGDAR